MKISKILAGAVLATSLAVGAAQAAMIDGTAGVGLNGLVIDQATIGVGTTFTYSSATVTGATGDMAPIYSDTGNALQDLINNAILYAGSFTATLNSVVTFTADWGSFSGQVKFVSASGDPDSRSVLAYILGTFTPANPGVFSGYDGAPMSLTFTANQTGGPGSAASASYSIASPPAPNPVPEPMSLALFGTALAGLGAVRSRRKA